MMALIVAIFAFFNYEVLLSDVIGNFLLKIFKNISAHSSYKNLSFAKTITISRIVFLVFACIIFAMIFFWQILIISR